MSAQGTRQTLVIGAASHEGMVRSVNQDFAYAGPLPGAAEWQFLAVADGLGGHAGGEWASQRAMEVVAGELGELVGERGPAAALEAALEAANSAVHQEGPKRGARGAATTFVAALCKGNEVWWVNVGDSRLYLASGEGLRQVSCDHSWVAEQVRDGALTSNEARGHARRNVVTRTVGFEPGISPETGGPIRLEPGDALLLCSDGLHGPVDDATLGRTVTSLEPAHAAARLIELANAAGGPDNVTAVVARAQAAASSPAETRIVVPSVTAEVGKPRSGAWRWIAGALGAVPVLGAFAGAVWYWGPW